MEAKIIQLAACEFLRRGCIGENLRKELTNFANWLEQREAEGDKINRPEKILPNWRTIREHTTAPECGGIIANFAAAIECSDIEALCSIGKIGAAGNVLYIWLYADSRKNAEERARKVDAAMIHKEQAARAFAAAAGASSFEYRIMQTQ